VFVNSLKKRLQALWDENQRLKEIAVQHLPSEIAEPLLSKCISEQPSVLEDEKQSEFVQQMDRPDTTMISLLQEAQRSYVITDPHQADNPIIWVSQYFCQMTGYERDEIIGRNCRFLQGPATDPQVVSQIRKAVNGQYPESFCIINYRKDGSPFWNNLYMSPLFNKDKQVTHFIGVQCDVTAAQAPMASTPNDCIPVQFQGLRAAPHSS